MDEKNASRWALFSREERESIKGAIEDCATEYHHGEYDRISANLVEEIEYIDGEERR